MKTINREYSDGEVPFRYTQFVKLILSKQVNTQKIDHEPNNGTRSATGGYGTIGAASFRARYSAGPIAYYI